MAFLYDGAYLRSSLLEETGALHSFSTRAGGVSVLPHTASMNVAFGRGDSDATVRRNIEIFIRNASRGKCGEADTVYASQIHSANVSQVFAPGEAEPADGFITDRPGIALMVKIADCVPILMAGKKGDRVSAVAAVHAGWRGTVSGIVRNAVSAFRDLGVSPENIKCAIGPSIRRCCYEVSEDFYSAVSRECGAAFADRHIKITEGKCGEGMYADLIGMNLEILLNSGVPEDSIDVSRECTACDPNKFFSHRITHGIRGTMGAVIILP